MDAVEIRMRCIEAATRTPLLHNDGPAAGALETAKKWAAWIEGDQGKTPPRTLSLPVKK